MLKLLKFLFNLHKVRDVIEVLTEITESAREIDYGLPERKSREYHVNMAAKHLRAILTRDGILA